MVKVVVLGAGNVAYHLTNKLLDCKNIQLVQVYNRDIEKIKYLTSKTTITNNLNQLAKADVYVISVSDNAVPILSKKINAPNKLVVHTCGSLGMNELKCNAKKGVLYLLQTFSKNRDIDFTKVPMCIEAQTEADLITLHKIANALSNSVYIINSKQRIKLHTAAVFVNNFVNHLYFQGQEICKNNDVSFDVLKPLILETASKVNELPPFDAQTGPAKRNDTLTLNKHYSSLKNNQLKIYKLLTKSIIETYGKKL